MACILCLSTAADEVMNLFDEKGLSLHISEVITQHFWLQPNADEANVKVICCSCWKALDSFHKFYLQIREAHANVVDLKPTVPVDDESDSDHFDTNSELVSKERIKQETNEDANDNFGEKSDLKLEKQSDSESDLPLANFSKRMCPTKDVTWNRNKPQCDTLKRTRKKPTEQVDKRCNKKLVNCKQFDDVIEQNMTLSCHICNKPLSRFFILKHHYQTVHNEVGYVICCEKKFDSRHSLAHHILLHQNPEIFKCEKCGKVLNTNKSLKNHMKVHKNEGEIHTCHKCRKSFSRVEKLERHMQTHEKSEQICEQCGKVTRDKTALRQHQLQKHSSTPRQRVPCEKCGVDFADNSGLHTHMKYLHPKTEVTHMCNICGRISATAYGLKRHIKYMHKCERRHKCTMCGKAFKMAQILREHMTTHTGEVLYTCPHCPKTFNSNANMHSHRKKMHRKEWEENRRYPHAVTAANTE